jgi:hypothetical protein
VLFVVSQGAGGTFKMTAVSGITDEVALSGADLSLARGKFVKWSGETLVLCGEGEPALGVVINNPLAAVGSQVQVRTMGVAPVLLAGTLAANVQIASGALGVCKEAEVAVVNAADADGSFCMGELLEGGDAADFVSAYISPRGLLPSNFA